jgi:hypothetical protein
MRQKRRPPIIRRVSYDNRLFELRFGTGTDMGAVSKPKKLSELRAALEFNELVSTFVRAIHIGAVDMSHSASILANYQRFGSLFDQCCRFIADTLREEGVYGTKGRDAADVAAQALEEVRFFCVLSILYKLTRV